jgi:methionyl-tRNA formyltransferase
VKAAAQELGLPVHQPERVSREEGLAELRRLGPDLVVVAAFGEILGKEALAAPGLGAINLHASLLPRWRGAAPIQRAIMAGDRVTGVTAQWMAREMDAGDIILQRQVEIGEGEDYGSLHDRLAALAAEAAVEAVELIARGEAPRLPQDGSQASYGPPITAGDLVMDWRRPAEELARQVRALSPRPGARTTRGGEMLKVLSARAEMGASGGLRGAAGGGCGGFGAAEKNGCGGGGIPGQVMESGSDGFRVAAGDPPTGRLLVLRVQPAGRKAMSAGDYVKGYRLRREERLGWCVRPKAEAEQ